MKDKVNVIGVQEKRELAKIISAEYDRTIADIKQSRELTEGDILKKIMKKFGVESINKKIQSLEQEISFLRDKKKELGFDHADKFTQVWKDGEYMVDPSTPAGRIFYLKVARIEAVNDLHKQRDTRIKKIWLTDERDTVKEISNEKIKINELQITYDKDQQK